MPACAQDALPPVPGAIDPAVTQANISTTICVAGWTRTIRPPEEVTYRIKRHLVQASDGGRLRDYELDHLVPLELGGAPDDPRNLWIEPRDQAQGWTAERKDELKGVLNSLVCGGRMPLAVAQQAIARNWIAAYRRYVGNE